MESPYFKPKWPYEIKYKINKIKNNDINAPVLYS